MQFSPQMAQQIGARNQTHEGVVVDDQSDQAAIQNAQARLAALLKASASPPSAAKRGRG